MTDWEKCVEFHGHSCGGLRIGYQAARYAMELLNIGFSDKEQVVCISENDACGVDAIQVMLGCSIGKGNLLFHMTGKQAFSFYNRASGQSVRLLLKPKPADMTPEESSRYYLTIAAGNCSRLCLPDCRCPPRRKFLTATTVNAAGKRPEQTGSALWTAESSALTAAEPITVSMCDAALRRGAIGRTDEL